MYVLQDFYHKNVNRFDKKPFKFQLAEKYFSWIFRNAIYHSTFFFIHLSKSKKLTKNISC